jgi:hypothetical protein
MIREVRMVEQGSLIVIVLTKYTVLWLCIGLENFLVIEVSFSLYHLVASYTEVLMIG